MKNRFVPGIRFLPVLGNIGTSIMETKKRDTIDVNNFHEILGHLGEAVSLMSVRLVQLKKKTRQKNFKIEWKGGISIHEEHLYMEISSFKGSSFGRFNFWALSLQLFKLLLELFLKKKDRFKDRLVKLIKELKHENIHVESKK
jgi:hypothetical protein